MENKDIKITPGLHPLKEDERDFPLGAIYTPATRAQIPDSDFVVCDPFIMKNQIQDDFCTAYTITEISEDQEMTELSPEFQFAATKKIMGDYKSWGADLRAACKSAQEIGSLSKAHADKWMNDNGHSATDRDFMANWENWPKSLFDLAALHKKDSFFAVTGPYDFFDNIRSSLWCHKADRSTVAVGVKWRDKWTTVQGGIIPKIFGSEGFGHAFKFFGQKIIDGEPHLIAQLSNGPIGDNGLFYFPREVVNYEMKQFGAFMFKDMPAETAKKYIAYGIKNEDSLLVKWWKSIIGLIFNK